MRRHTALLFVAASLSLALLGGCSCSSPRPRDGGLTDDAATLDDGAVPPDAGTDDAASPPATPHLAEGVTLEGLSVLEGTLVPIASGGVPLSARNAPLVAGRRALVRVYASAPSPRAVTAEVEVREGDRFVAVHSQTRNVSGVPSDADPASVIDVEIPAAELTTTASIAVRLVDPSGPLATAAPHPARLPRDGSALALGARDDGAGLRLVLVPLRWDHDGSGRLPDTSDAWLTKVRELLLALYPIAHLDLSVHDPVPWDDALTFTGNVDFGAVNGMLMDLRVSDAAPDDAYYYALVAPASSYSAYCGGSCVTGQSYVVDDPADADLRVGSGVGFGSDDSAWTLAHEVGHELGRYHAPCDTSGADADYPYAGGEIGNWGWDARTGELLEPSTTYDFMGYCDPEWTSDYTWSAIFDRVAAVHALSARARSPHLVVRLDTPRGALIAGVRSIRTPRTREATAITWLDASGTELGTDRAPTIHDGEERVVVLPAAPAGAARVRVGAYELAVPPFS